MRIFIAFGLIVFFLFSCESNNTNENRPKLAAPAFEKLSISDSCCAGLTMEQTTRINLDWIVVKGENQKGCNSINEGVRQNIVDIIHTNSCEEDSIEIKDSDPISKAISTYLSCYERESKYDDSFLPWYLNIRLDTAHITNILYSFSIEVESFSGGAHGYNATYYLHFDPSSGIERNMRDFFPDTTLLSASLENAFRQMKGLKSFQSLEEGGLFEDVTGKFPLPEEMTFDEQGLVAIYNPYDLAPYSEGKIMLELNHETVERCMNYKKKP